MTEIRSNDYNAFIKKQTPGAPVPIKDPQIHPTKPDITTPNIMDPFFQLFEMDAENKLAVEPMIHDTSTTPGKGFFKDMMSQLRRFFQTNGFHMNTTDKEANTHYNNTDFNGNDSLHDVILNDGYNNNRLFGLGGNDTLYTKNGQNNKLFGGEGNDYLYAYNEKNVKLYGDAGDDEFRIDNNVSGLIDGGKGDKDKLDIGAFIKDGNIDLSKFSVDKHGNIVIKTDRGKVTIKNVEEFFFNIQDGTISGKVSIPYDGLVKQIQKKTHPQPIPIPIPIDPKPIPINVKSPPENYIVGLSTSELLHQSYFD